MTVTEIKPNKKNKGRVSIYLDGEFGFSCYTEMIEDECISVGMHLRPDDVARLKGCDTEQYAWRTALGLLGSGMRTEKQICDKLKKRGVAPDMLEHTVERLRESRLVDDMEYARLYAEQLYERYGIRRVSQKLRERGITQEIIDQVATSPGDERVLVRNVRRLFDKNRHDDPYVRDQKIIRSMAYKGFEYSDIRKAIGICEAENDGCRTYDE